MQERISEWAGFSVELVDGRMYKDKTDRELAEIKRDLDSKVDLEYEQSVVRGRENSPEYVFGK